MVAKNGAKVAKNDTCTSLWKHFVLFIGFRSLLVKLTSCIDQPIKVVLLSLIILFVTRKLNE